MGPDARGDVLRVGGHDTTIDSPYILFRDERAKIDIAR